MISILQQKPKQITYSVEIVDCDEHGFVSRENYVNGKVYKYRHVMFRELFSDAQPDIIKRHIEEALLKLKQSLYEELNLDKVVL